MDQIQLRIMVAENVESHLEAIFRALHKASFPVVIRVVKSIPEYREEAVNNPPDIALLSLNLPGGQAIDLLTFPAEAGRFPVLIMINPKSKKIIGCKIPGHYTQRGYTF